MKYKLTLSVLVIFVNMALGQATYTLPNDSKGEGPSFLDRPASDHVLDFQRKKHFVSRGNVALATFNFPSTDIENQIIDMENLEIKALLNRDTAALRMLWLRDFTLDAPQNDLLRGNNPIPYYVRLSRLVEKLTILGDMVITSGTEYSILLNTNGQVEEEKEETYTHSWIRDNFSWKLATKIHH